MGRSSEFERLVGSALRYWFPDVVLVQSARPDWLKGLEYDFFIPELHAAFEVQGPQHYLYVPKMQASVREFDAQRRRDEMKRDLSHRHNVALLSIRSFDGIYKKMRNAFPDRTFPVLPAPLRTEWKNYRRMIHIKKNKEWVAIKVKGNGALVGINRKAAEYLASDPKGSAH